MWALPVQLMSLVKLCFMQEPTWLSALIFFFVVTLSWSVRCLAQIQSSAKAIPLVHRCVQGAHKSDCSVIHTVSLSMFCHVTKATCSDLSMLMATAATVLGQLSQIDTPYSRLCDPWSMRCPSKLILKTATQQIQAESYHHLHPPKSFDAEDTRPYQACGKLPWSL